MDMLCDESLSDSDYIDFIDYEDEDKDDDDDYPDEPEHFDDDDDDDEDDEEDDEDDYEDYYSDSDEIILSLGRRTYHPTNLFLVSAKCCVCYLDGKGIVDITQGPFLQGIHGLIEHYQHFTELFRDDNTLADRGLIGSSCQNNDHCLCVGCMRQIIYNKELCISQLKTGKGNIPCQYSSGTTFCQNSLGDRTTFPSSLMSGILPTTETVKFYRLVESVLKIIDMEVGHASDNYNHYVYKSCKNKMQRDYPGMLKHCEVDSDTVFSQLKEIINSETGNVKCKQCLTDLEHGEACSSLSHCGVKICSICGRSDAYLEDEIHHWKSDKVPHGCPRFIDTDSDLAKMGYKCKEYVCYDQYSLCGIPEHKSGKNALILYKKKKQIECLFNSLKSEIKEDVIRLLSGDSECETFLKTNKIYLG